jgi:hypothetical protein
MTYPFADDARRGRLARTARALAVLVVLVLAALAAGGVWLGLAARDVRDGVERANSRLAAATRAALAPAGDPLEEAQTTLLVGRGTRGRALSVLLLRTDPDRRRVATLVLSPDVSRRVLRVDRGRMVERVSRIVDAPVHHVVSLDIVAVGRLVEQTGPVLGRDRAAAVALARGGRDPARAAAAQARLLESIAKVLLRPAALLDARELARAITRPIAGTDLSARELARIAWVRAEATDGARCRLSDRASRRATLRAFLSGAPAEAGACSASALTPLPLPTRSTAVAAAVAYVALLLAAVATLLGTSGSLRLELRTTRWGELPYARVSLAGRRALRVNVIGATFAVFLPLLALQAALAFR